VQQPPSFGWLLDCKDSARPASVCRTNRSDELRGTERFQQATGRLAVVVALHGALIYALVHGLARQIVEVIRQTLETKISREVKAPPPTSRLRPRRPSWRCPPAALHPPPEVTVQVPVSAPTIHRSHERAGSGRRRWSTPTLARNLVPAGALRANRSGEPCA